MDIKRSILLVALAVVAYLMVLQWNQDYGQAALPTETAQSQPAAPAAGQPERNDRGQCQRRSGGCRSAAGQRPADQRTEQPVDPRPYRRARHAIDPRGGDIVELHLPQYPRRQDRPDVPFQLFERSSERTYEAQSGLIGDGPDKASGRPQYSSEKTEYQLAEGQDALVVDLNYSADGVNYIKRFTTERGNYALKVNYLIDNQSQQPRTGYLFGQLKRDKSGDPSSSTATGTATYLGAALWTKDEPYRKVSMSNMDDKNLRETVQGGWIAWLQHYFVTARIPKPATPIRCRPARTARAATSSVSPARPLPCPPAPRRDRRHAVCRSKSRDKLEELSPGLRLTVDYGILWFIAQPIFWLLQNIHALLGNWGWSIIVLTIVIAGVLPLSAASYRSMARMRAVSPKMQALKEQFGDDRQKMSRR